VDFKTVSETLDQQPSSTNEDSSFSFKENVKLSRNLCNKSGTNSRSLCKRKSFGSKTSNIPSFVPEAAYVPAGSRNPPASVSTGSVVPAGSRNIPASVPAGKPLSVGWRNHAARP
ncbi:hypothetical protein Tco_0427165, partial [Tanacetum coccineum]